MSFRNTASAALCAAAVLTTIAAPAGACDTITCPSVIQAKPAKPLPLAKFVHKPVATAAVRTVKTHVSTARQAKADPRPLAMPARPSEIAAKSPAERIPPAAARAYASTQVFGSTPYAIARVRVVTPEDLSEINAKANAAAFAPAPYANNPPTTAYNGVKIVSADAINEIDLKADTIEPAALDAATPERIAGSDTGHGTTTLLQRMLVALGGAFATAAAAVKALAG